MEKLTLDSFGEIIDQFLKDNEICMLLTLPERTLDVQVQDNVNLGSTVQFYILLNAIVPICDAMLKDMGIERKSAEWEKVVDTILGMIKDEIMGRQPMGLGDRV